MIRFVRMRRCFTNDSRAFPFPSKSFDSKSGNSFTKEESRMEQRLDSDRPQFRQVNREQGNRLDPPKRPFTDNRAETDRFSNRPSFRDGKPFQENKQFNGPPSKRTFNGDQRNFSGEKAHLEQRNFDENRGERANFEQRNSGEKLHEHRNFKEKRAPFEQRNFNENRGDKAPFEQRNFNENRVDKAPFEQGNSNGSRRDKVPFEQRHSNEKRAPSEQRNFNEIRGDKAAFEQRNFNEKRDFTQGQNPKFNEQRKNTLQSKLERPFTEQRNIPFQEKRPLQRDPRPVSSGKWNVNDSNPRPKLQDSTRPKSPKSVPNDLASLEDAAPTLLSLDDDDYNSRKSRKLPEKKPVASKSSKSVKQSRRHSDSDEDEERKDFSDEEDEEVLLQRRIKADQDRQRQQALLKERQQRVLVFGGMWTSELAQRLSLSRDQCTKLLASYMDHTPGAMEPLSLDVIQLAVQECDRVPVLDEEQVQELTPRPVPDDKSLLKPRPPVIVIMGHVDHGKTTLLDWFRRSHVAAGEAGGITQHIGAFSVMMPSGKRMTFLDTPGHAAFTTIRARGAQCTDIVVLVVAGDDGVMPQTLESIRLAKEAKVPIIVAINKMDKKTADAERVQRELLQHGLAVEAMGGDIQCIGVSAQTGLGMQQLEESITALAEVVDLRAEEEGPVEGVVLEAKQTHGCGDVASVLVQRGTLRHGQVLVAGMAHVRVRSMRDATGHILTEAGPGTPVELLGWRESPPVGALLLQAKDEAHATAVIHRRQIVEENQNSLVSSKEEALLVPELPQKQQKQYSSHGRVMHQGEASATATLPTMMTLEDKSKNTVCLILKTDVMGSMEAVHKLLQEIPQVKLQLRILHCEVGDVTPSDVEMATQAKAILIAFNVKMNPVAARMAERHQITVLSYRVIYHLMDALQKALLARLPPVYQDQIVGEAHVLQIFSIALKRNKQLVVAGCSVQMGVMEKQGSNEKEDVERQVIVQRQGKQIHRGPMSSLKHFKKEVDRVQKDQECGIALEGFEQFEVGDVFQCVKKVLVTPLLT